MNPTKLPAAHSKEETLQPNKRDTLFVSAQPRLLSLGERFKHNIEFCTIFS